MPSSKRQRPQFAPRNLNAWQQQQVPGPTIESTMQQPLYSDLSWVQPTQEQQSVFNNLQYQSHYLQQNQYTQNQYLQQNATDTQYQQHPSQYTHFMQAQNAFPQHAAQYAQVQPAATQSGYSQLYHADMAAHQLQYAVDPPAYVHPTVQPFQLSTPSISPVPAISKSPRGPVARSPPPGNSNSLQQATVSPTVNERNFRQTPVEQSPTAYPPRRTTYQNNEQPSTPRERPLQPRIGASQATVQELRNAVQRPYIPSPGRGRFGRGRWTRGGGMGGRATEGRGQAGAAAQPAGDTRRVSQAENTKRTPPKPVAPAATAGAPHLDIKNQLQELLQQLHLPLPSYTLQAWDGVSHEPYFRYQASVTIEGKEFVAAGAGKTKKDGQREAAAKLLKCLREDATVLAALERIMQGKWARSAPHWLGALGFKARGAAPTTATGEAGAATDQPGEDGSAAVPTLPGTSGQTNLGWVNDAANQPLDIKNRLQELCQKLGAEFPSYHLVRQAGPSHMPMFTVQGSCIVAGITLTKESTAASKKQAEKGAAEWLLTTLTEDERIKEALTTAERRPFRSPRGAPVPPAPELPPPANPDDPNATPPAEVKNRLQELCQKLAVGLPSYEMISRLGPVHDPVFNVRASVLETDTPYHTEGSGRSKKDAEKDAASKLLNLLKDDPALKDKLNRRTPEPRFRGNKATAALVSAKHELSKLLHTLGSSPAVFEQVELDVAEPHRCSFKVTASYNDTPFTGSGIGHTKKDAQRRATQALLAAMVEDAGVQAAVQAKRAADAERAAAAAAAATAPAAQPPLPQTDSSSTPAENGAEEEADGSESEPEPEEIAGPVVVKKEEAATDA